MTARPPGLRFPAALVMAVFLSLVATPPAAHACSCFQADPRDALAGADGAFVGTLTGVGAPDEQGLAVYSFDVETTVKGDIGASIDVRAGSNDANCGFEAEIGDRVGLFTYMEEAQWVSGLCNQIDPEALLAAAAPLPVPDGVGPARFVVGVNIGRHRLISLDGGGRTLAYGKGEGYAIDVDLCPGSERVVEAARIDRSGVLVVHELPSLEVVRRIELVSGPPFPRVEVACLNRSGGRLVAVERHAGDRWVHVIEGVHDRIVWHGRARSVTIQGRRVVILDGRRVSTVDLDTGDLADVVVLPSGADSPAISPGGSWVAAFMGDPTGEAEILSVRVADGSVTEYTLEALQFVDGHILWLDPSTFLYLPADGQTSPAIFEASTMEPSLGPSNWYGGPAVVSGGMVFGTAWGALISARLPNGDVHPIRLFESPETGVLDVVPRDAA